MAIKKRMPAQYDAKASLAVRHVDVKKKDDEKTGHTRSIPTNAVTFIKAEDSADVKRNLDDEKKGYKECILINAVLLVLFFICSFALNVYPVMMSFSSEDVVTKLKVNMPTIRGSTSVQETFSTIECNASEDSISALMKSLPGKENIALGKEAAQSSTGNGEKVNDVNTDERRNCGCPHTCTEAVLATGNCEERIKFLMRRYKHPHLKACRDASLDRDSSCGDACNPDVCPKSPSLAGPAQMAVDGNTDQSYSSGSVSATTIENNPWWQVDLGAVYKIEKVVIYNRGDARSEHLKRFHVDILNANEDGSWEIEDHVYSEDEAGLVALVAFKKGIKGQVVRIRVDGYASINLAEVEVYGVAIG